MQSHHAHNAQCAKRRCDIDPLKYKTQMCQYHVSGKHCPFDPWCAYAHGPEELRSYWDNAEIATTRPIVVNTLPSVVVHHEIWTAAVKYTCKTGPATAPLKTDPAAPPKPSFMAARPKIPVSPTPSIAFSDEDVEHGNLSDGSIDSGNRSPTMRRNDPYAPVFM